jgi:hypothetical protein
LWHTPTPKGGIHHPIRAIPGALRAAIVGKFARERQRFARKGSDMTLKSEVDNLESHLGSRFR